MITAESKLETQKQNNKICSMQLETCDRSGYVCDKSCDMKIYNHNLFCEGVA